MNSHTPLAWPLGFETLQEQANQSCYYRIQKNHALLRSKNLLQVLQHHLHTGTVTTSQISTGTWRNRNCYWDKPMTETETQPGLHPAGSTCKLSFTFCNFILQIQMKNKMMSHFPSRLPLLWCPSCPPRLLPSRQPSAGAQDTASATWFPTHSRFKALHLMFSSTVLLYLREPFQQHIYTRVNYYT